MNQNNRFVATVSAVGAFAVLAACGAAPSARDGSSATSSTMTSLPFLSFRPTMSASFGGLDPGVAALPEPSCDLRPGSRGLITRVAGTNSGTYASITSDVDIDNCRPKLETFQQNAATGPGLCTTIAFADDNAGYDFEMAPPLREVIDQAGDAC